MNSSSTIRRKAAAKADKQPGNWQAVFDAELERLTDQERLRIERRKQGIQIKRRHWRYLGDLSAAPSRSCGLPHIAKQNGDAI
jgi:hypothetical protein